VPRRLGFSLRTITLSAFAAALAVAVTAVLLAYSCGRIASTSGASAVLAAAAAVLAALAAITVRAVSSSCRQLSSQVERVAAALHRGDLAARVHAADVPAELREAMESLNGGLDRTSSSIDAIRLRLERLSTGDIPEQLASDHGGTFAAISESMNRCVGAIEATLSDIATVARETSASSWKA
jgi:methyl-accepting chemotaxis protein